MFVPQIVTRTWNPQPKIIADNLKTESNKLNAITRLWWISVIWPWNSTSPRVTNWISRSWCHPLFVGLLALRGTFFFCIFYLARRMNHITIFLNKNKNTKLWARKFFLSFLLSSLAPPTIVEQKADKSKASVASKPPKNWSACLHNLIKQQNKLWFLRVFPFPMFSND